MPFLKYIKRKYLDDSILKPYDSNKSKSIANITNTKKNFYVNILSYYVDRTKYVLQGYDDSGVREVDNLLIRPSSFILY